jgi:hypothetical protein
MTANEVLLEAFSRLPDLVEAAVDGLPDEQLAARIDPEANSVAWLVWHLARVQDDHVGGAFDHEQVWTAQGWAARFDLPLAVHDIGYGHTADHAGSVRAGAELLTEYYGAVHARTLELLATVSAEDLDRVVDRSFDPPVTLGVRLVSVLQDVVQHAGQAAFARGVLDRTGTT